MLSNVIKNGSSKITEKTLETLGFTNVPSGNWIIKKGSKTISAKSSTIIPLVIKSISASVSYRKPSTTSSSSSTSKKINSINVLALSSTATGDSTMSWIQTDSNATAYNIFIPSFYSFDLSKTQNGYTNGTLSAWLEKVGGVTSKLRSLLVNAFGKKVLTC